MCRHTCLVASAFSATLIAAILGSIAISTDNWLLGRTSPDPTTNVTNTCYKGLWVICCENIPSQADFRILECHMTGANGKDSTPARIFRAVQYTFSGGLIVTTLGMFIMAIYYLVKSLHGCKLYTAINTVILWLAGALFLVAIVMFVEHFKRDNDFSDKYHVRLDWSFWVGVASCVVAFVSAALSTYNTALVKAGGVYYEQLDINP